MAYSEPQLPDSVDFRFAGTALRTYTLPTATELDQWCRSVHPTYGGPIFGDDVSLVAGTDYTGFTFRLPVPTGTLEASDGEYYVTIRSSNLSSLPAAGTRVSPSDSINMPRFVSSSTFGIITTLAGAHHYRLIGLEFTTDSTSTSNCISMSPPGAGASTYLVSANFPSYVSIERCYIHPDYDYGCRTPVALMGSHVQLIDSYLDNCMSNGTAEGKAVWIHSGAGPYLIENDAIGGMGENIFIQGTSFGNTNVIPGLEWEMSSNITIRRCYIFRRLSWKRDHATYLQPCNSAGSGTFTSIGVNATFTNTQAFVSTSTTASYIKNLSTGEVRRIASGSGKSWVLASAFSADVTTAQTFRTNRNSFGNEGAPLQCKNMLEPKGVKKLLVEQCVFENGWADQQPYPIWLAAREGGFIRDITFRWNKLIACGGASVSAGESQYGNDFWPSYSASRVKLSQCLWDNPLTTDVLSLRSSASFVLDVQGGPGLSLIGRPWSGVGTVQAGAGAMTVGTVDVTFTFSTTVCRSHWVGAQIRYGVGRATITAYTDTTHIKATITVAFPDLDAHAISLWSVAHESIIGHGHVSDSMVFEHITAAGPNQSVEASWLVGDNTPPVQDAAAKGTNHVIRYNLVQNSFGVKHRQSSGGTTAINDVLDSSTRVFSKNVFFGATASSFDQLYTGTDNGGMGSAFNTAFHAPDHTGSTAGGAIGFTDYANRDYTLTASSPYNAAANWTGDGLPVGCDIATLNTYIAGVVDGDAEEETEPVAASTREYSIVRFS